MRLLKGTSEEMPMGRKSKYTPKLGRTLSKKYNAGASTCVLAKLFDLSPQTVADYVRKAGGKINPRCRRIRPVTGRVFGFLIATGKWKIVTQNGGDKLRYWEVRCPHGATKFVRGTRLTQGDVESCTRWKHCPIYNITGSPEYQTVKNYYECIHVRKVPNYVGMPFFQGWLPSDTTTRPFETAALWIRENLGPRPEGCSLYVIVHALGVVPGNLEWTHPRKQLNQQMYKIIVQQKNQIKVLNAANDIRSAIIKASEYEKKILAKQVDALEERFELTPEAVKEIHELS
jgi:hypothetical protein